MFTHNDLEEPVIYNAGYQGGLDWEAVRKVLLGNDWGTKLFPTQSLGCEFFYLKETTAFISFARTVASNMFCYFNLKIPYKKQDSSINLVSPFNLPYINSHPIKTFCVKLNQLGNAL